MTAISAPHIRPGLPRDDAHKLNQYLRDLSRFFHVSTSGGLGHTLDAGGLSIYNLAQAQAATPVTQFFPARITGPPVENVFSQWAYPWKEQEQRPNGTFRDLVGGRSGTTSVNPAYEICYRYNVPASQDLAVPPSIAKNTVVWMTKGFLNSGGAGQEYLFFCPNVTISSENPQPLTTDTAVSYTPSFDVVFDMNCGLKVLTEPFTHPGAGDSAARVKVTIYDTAGNLSGVVNRTDQYLGAGIKYADGFVANNPFSGSRNPGFYSQTQLWAMPSNSAQSLPGGDSFYGGYIAGTGYNLPPYAGLLNVTCLLLDENVAAGFSRIIAYAGDPSGAGGFFNSPLPVCFSCFDSTANTIYNGITGLNNITPIGQIRFTGGLVTQYTPGTPATVTGSRGGNVALANLLSILAAAGIIVDGTTP